MSLKYSIAIFLNTKFQLFGTPKLTGVSYTKQVVDENTVIHFDNPVNLDARPHWKFRERQEIHFPETFVTEMDQARVWGNQGAVITKDNILFDLVSREFDSSGKHHSLFKQWRIIAHTSLQGRIAVIAASGNEVYYHWMMDIIPRIDLLIRSGVFASIDKFILNYRQLPFQLELLAMLGIPEKKIIPSTDHWNFHVEVSTLVVPSLVSPNDCPSKKACLFIRKLFMMHKSSRIPYRKIYIKRTKGRTIINEPEILGILEKEGFEILHPENMTVAEQAYVFSETKYVIGAHGAGLTNIVFCEPGTKVIDIFPPEWVNPCYWILSRHLELHYAYLMGEGKTVSEGVDLKDRAADIQIDPQKLEELMNLL